jgi:ABC-type polysaccharide/polyol phosphate export permease
MFERFSDQARRVILSGQDAAQQRGHLTIGTEHMLLGLVGEDDCHGAGVLERLEISATDVRQHIDQLVGCGDSASGCTGPIPFTLPAKKVLELSAREALRLGHREIGTEHMLLGMVRERDGVAGQVLVELGADLLRTREAVVDLLSELGSEGARTRAAAEAQERAAGTAEPPTGPRPDLIDWDDPAALGAAATFSGQGTRSPQRAAARPARASVRAPQHGDAHTGAADGRVDDDDDDDAIVSVFEAGKSVRPELRPYLQSLWERRPFMMALAKAEIRGRRSSTMLGSIWGLIDPVFQASIYLFLFFIIRGGQGKASSFLPVLLGGMFLFRFTGTAINDGGRSVRNSRDLMLSSTFPRAVLPLSAIYKGVLNFIPSIFVFGVVYLFFGNGFTFSLLFLPVLFAIQTLTNVGIALIMSTATVFVRDMDNALSMITRVLLFVTPVIYPINLLPPDLQSILSLNPLYPLFANYQSIIGATGVDLGLVVQSVFWAFALTGAGAWLFLRYEHAMAAAA